MIGNAPAADTSGGMGVGPGDIRRYLFIMGWKVSSLRGRIGLYSRLDERRWLHDRHILVTGFTKRYYPIGEHSRRELLQVSEPAMTFTASPMLTVPGALWTRF